MNALTTIARPAIAATFAAVTSLAASAMFALARPDLARGAAFLFGDEAANLFVADAIQSGRTLYAEVAYPYGPVAITIYAEISRVFGNTPVTYLTLMSVLSAVSMGMTGWLLGRSAPLSLSLPLIVLSLVPTMPLPGATIGGYTSSIYMPLERICLLTALILWRPPGAAGWGRRLAVGAVLGLCQGVRFGSGVVALAAILAVDVFAHRGAARPAFARVQSALVIAGGFAIVQTLWVVWATATLPPADAATVLWPLHMYETHRTSTASRWPPWIGVAAFATQYALPIAALALGGLASARWLFGRIDASHVRDVPHGRVVALFGFFVLGALTYFRNEHHFRQFAWTIMPAAAVGVLAAPRIVVALALLVMVPALWPLASAVAAGAPSGIAPVAVPRGYSLSLAPDGHGRLAFLGAFTGVGRVVFVPNGAGWLFAYRVPHATRHTWFYSRAVVRPAEYQAFLSGLADADLVIACDAPEHVADWPIPAPVHDLIEGAYHVTAEGAGCVVRTRTPHGR